MVTGRGKARLSSGFGSIREGISYLIGAATLFYGVVEATPDKALVVISAGVALLGAPMVGSIFNKKKDGEEE